MVKGSGASKPCLVNLYGRSPRGKVHGDQAEALTLQWDSAELPESCFHRILSTKNGNGIMVV